MRANWFLAFPFDGEFSRNLPPPPRGFRLFHPDDVHLTLAFLGGVGEERARRALDALDARLVGTSAEAFEVSLAEVVPMGSKSAYTALSALLGAGRGEAEARIASLRDALTSAANARPDSRPPKPHVTLARPPRSAGAEARKEGLAWAASLDLSGVRTRLERVALYTWSDDRRARWFRIVESRELIRTDAGPARNG